MSPFSISGCPLGLFGGCALTLCGGPRLRSLAGYIHVQRPSPPSDVSFSSRFENDRPVLKKTGHEIFVYILIDSGV